MKAAMLLVDRRYGRRQAWAAVPSQSQISSRVPSAVLPPVDNKATTGLRVHEAVWSRQRHS